MTYFRSLSAAGFAATAISYGPARIGFGLFVPEFKSTFSLSTTMIGFISSLGFLGFFIALTIAQAMLNRRGPEVPVLSGLSAAAAGMTIVALANNATMLAAGVFLAAASAGFAWTPFNDAVHRKIRDIDRPTALSEISTGTSIGVASAGIAALAVVFSGFSWRACWAIFAISGIIALLANRAALRPVEPAPDPGPGNNWRVLLCTGVIPIFVVAFVFGTTSAIYISFAADYFSSEGGVPGIPNSAVPAFVFIFYGIFGLAGLLTGRAKVALGLPWLLRLVMLSGAASVALVVIAPNNWLGFAMSAGLQGIHVMMTSAVLAFWSERLFPSIPSLSFTSALLATAAGNVLGPALAGVVWDMIGPWPMFLGTATLPLLTATLLRDRHAQERPAVQTGRHTASA